MDNLEDPQNAKYDTLAHYQKAIIGPTNTGANAYSLKKMVKITENDGLDYYEAVDFVLQNVTLFMDPADIILMDLE